MEVTTPTTYLQRINTKMSGYKDTLQSFAGDEIKALANNEELDAKHIFIETCKVVKAYYALLSNFGVEGE